MFLRQTIARFSTPRIKAHQTGRNGGRRENHNARILLAAPAVSIKPSLDLRALSHSHIDTLYIPFPIPA